MSAATLFPIKMSHFGNMEQGNYYLFLLGLYSVKSGNLFVPDLNFKS